MHYKYHKKSSEEVKKEVDSLTDKLNEGVKDFLNSEQYKQLLENLSKFHNYSFNNSLLITLQKPEASRVASYSTWAKDFNKAVKQGEKSIRILAPCPYEITLKEPKKGLNGENLLDENGKEIVEETRVSCMRFKIAHVFDISQTQQIEGKPVVDIDMAKELKFDVNDYKTIKKAIENAAKIPVSYEEINDSSKGYYSLDENRIVVKTGMSQSQTIKTLLHETAHSILHKQDERNFYASVDGTLTKNLSAEEAMSSYKKSLTLDNNSDVRVGVSITDRDDKTLIRDIDLVRNGEAIQYDLSDKNSLQIEKAAMDVRPITLDSSENIRTIRELQAESCAYVVSNHYGLDTSDYSFGYIASWSDANPEALLKELSAIKACSNEMVSDIDKELEKLDLNAQLSESEKLYELASKIDDFSHSVDPYEYQDCELYPGHNFDEVYSQLHQGQVDSIREMLQDTMQNSQDLRLQEEARELIDELDGMSFMPDNGPALGLSL